MTGEHEQSALNGHSGPEKGPNGPVSGLSSSSAPIGVLIADDQPLVRMGLRALVRSDAGLALLGEAEAGAPDGPPDDGEAVGPSRPGAGASGSAGIVPEVSGRPHERPAEAPEIEQLKLW